MAGPSGFVSGPQAFADFGRVGGVAPPSGCLGLLSRAALHYAEASRDGFARVERADPPAAD